MTTIVARAVLPAVVVDVVQVVAQAAAVADALLVVVAPVVDARPAEAARPAMVTVMHARAQVAHRMLAVPVADPHAIAVRRAMIAAETMTVRASGRAMEIAHRGVRAHRVVTGRSARDRMVIVHSSHAATDRKVTARSSHVVIAPKVTGPKVTAPMATDLSGIALFGHARMVSALSVHVLKVAASGPIPRALPALMVSAASALSVRAVIMIVAANEATSHAARAMTSHAARAIIRVRAITMCAEIAPAPRAVPAARIERIVPAPRATSP